MGCKILLADDSITIQKVVNLTFDDEGIDVVAVSNGDQAERKLNEVNPDLVLADIFMPGKNGYELCELIKKSPRFSNVPVVLLVGAFEPFDQNEARRVGADDHLTKPFESRKLVETVRRLIVMRQQSMPEQPVEQPTAQEQAEDKSSRPTDSLEDRSERTTDPLDAKPFVQTLDLDMSGPPDPARPAESAGADQDVATGANDVSALNESAPIEIDYLPPAPQPEPAEQTDFHFAPPERTGDLSTESLQEEIAFETTPLEDFEFPVDNRSSEVMLEDGAEPAREGGAAQQRAWDESEAPHAFSFGEDTPDFEKLEEGEPPLSDTVFAVDVDAADSADSPSPRETREWASDASAWQPSSSRLDATGGQPYAAGQAGQAGETASATLLAVEDPLGDVLMDEAAPQQPVFEGQWRPAETAEGAELNLDFSSPEAAPLPPISEVAPEYAEAHREESEPLATEPVAALDQPSQEPAAAGEIVFNPEADLQTEPGYDFAPVQTGEAPDTNPDLPGYDLGQASESGFETISDEAVGFEADTPEREPAPDEAFTSSAMWTEEESRFAPIDIEAVPVDEASSRAAGQTQASAQETGFEFSQIITDDAGPDYPPATEPESEPTAAGQTGAQVVDLSQSAIDEIVRRVVAELSDKVVREIAWEVVPDMVERVVEKLARESLSKRT